MDGVLGMASLDAAITQAMSLDPAARQPDALQVLGECVEALQGLLWEETSAPRILVFEDNRMSAILRIS